MRERVCAFLKLVSMERKAASEMKYIISTSTAFHPILFRSLVHAAQYNNQQVLAAIVVAFVFSRRGNEIQKKN